MSNQVQSRGSFTSFVYSSDSDVRNWYRRVLREGGFGVSSTRITLLETLVGGLKTDGVWTKLDRLWLLAAELQTAALIDLKGAALATAIGSPTFTVDRGFAGQATGSPSKYLDSGYKESASGNVLSATSSHMSAWIVTLQTDNGHLVGSNTGTDVSQVSLNTGTPKVESYSTDQGSFGPASFTYSTGTGHWLGNRSASNLTTLYQNGASTGATGTGTNGTVNSTNAFILCRSNFGSPQSGVASTIGMVSMGGGLTGTDITNFYTRLRTFMTAIGVP